MNHSVKDTFGQGEYFKEWRLVEFKESAELQLKGYMEIGSLCFLGSQEVTWKSRLKFKKFVRLFRGHVQWLLTLAWFFQSRCQVYLAVSSELSKLFLVEISQLCLSLSLYGNGCQRALESIHHIEITSGQCNRTKYRVYVLSI